MNIFKQVQEQELDLQEVRELTEFIDAYIPSLEYMIEDIETKKKIIVNRLDVIKKTFIAFDQITPNELENKLLELTTSLEKCNKRLDLLHKVSEKYNYFINKIV
jgi:hypothetical protein